MSVTNLRAAIGLATALLSAYGGGKEQTVGRREIGRLFAADGRSWLVDVNSLAVAPGPNVFDDQAVRPLLPAQLFSVQDGRGEFAFLLVGHSPLGTASGYVVADSRTGSVVGLLSTNAVAGTTALLDVPSLSRIYVSFGRQLEGRGLSYETVAYHTKSFGPISGDVATDFRLTNTACLSSDGRRILSDRRIFDAANTTSIGPVAGDDSLVLVACHRDLALFLSRTKSGETRVSVFDWVSGRQRMSFVAAAPFRAETSHWAFGDGVVIHDVFESIKLGSGRQFRRTGQLQLFSLQNGKPLAHIDLALKNREDAGIITLSRDQRELLYRDGAETVIIDLVKHRVLGRLEIPTVGALWP
jgi:hypothetical protein